MTAFARIFGPVTGGLVWDVDRERSGMADYRSVFHLCAILMVISLLVSLRLPKKARSTESE